MDKTLANVLRELFVDQDKNDSMMHGDCNYDTNFINWKGVDVGEFADGYGKELTEAGISFEYVASYGGEGSGEQFWCVWKFNRGNEEVYFKFNGWYASYVGAEFSEVFEVQPVEKTITVWE